MDEYPNKTSIIKLINAFIIALFQLPIELFSTEDVTINNNSYGPLNIQIAISKESYYDLIWNYSYVYHCILRSGSLYNLKYPSKIFSK